MYQFANNCQFRAEDLNRIYEDAFGINKKNGWFVEVGASNGQDYSNTCGLADIGWDGIYVEPVKALAEKCRKRHYANTGVTVFNSAASKINGKRPLWMIPAWKTATSNFQAALEICQKVDSQPEEFMVNALKLDTILSCTMCPKSFDLLVIDVDFGEIDVLEGFHLDYWRPKLVIIELHEDNDHPNPLSKEVREFANPYFERNEYEKIYKDGINTIFKRA